MNKMNKKGFTLIEMLVVIAIIAVLVSIIVPVVGNSTTKAKAAADAANLRSIAASVAIDYMDNNVIDGTYTMPTSETDGTKTAAVYLVGNEIKAFYDKSGVEYFAAVAGGETVTAPTALPSGADKMVDSSGVVEKYAPAAN